MVSIPTYILAGGLSSRFGEDKAIQVVNGTTMLENVVNAVRSNSSNVNIISRSTQYEIVNTRNITDITPRIGPLGGLLTAYEDFAEEQFLLLSCDLPYLTPAFVEWFLQEVDTKKTNWLLSEKGHEPLIAVYHKDDKRHLIEMHSNKELSLRKLIDRTEINLIHASSYRGYSGKELLNINKKEDLLT